MELPSLDKLKAHESLEEVRDQHILCTFVDMEKRDVLSAKDMELTEKFLPMYFGVELKLR